MQIELIARRDGRLSGFLRGEMGISAGLMNKLKWQERFLVNGVPVHTDFPVREGDRILAILDEPEPKYPAEERPIRILYEDENFLAVDKEPGILIHPSRSRDTGTLANFVAGYYRRTEQASAFHPVTRLDRDTYGVVLLAKNAHIHAKMNGLHDAGLLQKTYHALVYGCWAEDRGIIDAPIGRKPLPSLLREIREDGKPSQTGFQVLERRENMTRLALRPITGRTHQLRLHCAYMGHPILGDPQYGTEQSGALSASLGLTHQLLCAKRICFTDPITGEERVIESQMDA
ncbi:MAG: RluA family pseudouridine synthase [Faecousia sp.]